MPGSATELGPFVGLKAYEPITDQVRINKHPNSIYVERKSQKYFGDAEIQWTGRRKKTKTTKKTPHNHQNLMSWENRAITDFPYFIISFAMPEEPGGEDNA